MHCIAGALFFLVACIYQFQGQPKPQKVPDVLVDGVCKGGTWGPYCNETCGNCVNDTHCDAQTGECPLGCGWGWVGPMCDQSCSQNFWGPNCSIPCGNCLTFVPCDTETGACQGGCANGWTGDTCHNRCNDGRWGQNCAETCGNCFTWHPCNTESGACQGGCLPGWLPPTCKSQNSTQQENSTQQALYGGSTMNVASYNVIVLVSIALLGPFGHFDVFVNTHN